MSVPSLTLLTTGRSITRSDHPEPFIVTDGDTPTAVMFELREPYMALADNSGRLVLNEQNMVEVGLQFLREGAEIKGFIGWNKEKTKKIGSLSKQTTKAVHLMEEKFTLKLTQMCTELADYAQRAGLIPRGRFIGGNLIRFDSQYRYVGQKAVLERERDINTLEQVHLDTMQVEPHVFAPEHGPTVVNLFETSSTDTAEGIAVLFYLSADQSWTGTELCLPLKKETDLILKPTAGDVVIMNEKTQHGRCNIGNLAGADKPGEHRILLRITMPYDPI